MEEGGGGDATTHMTSTEPCGCNIAKCHSMSFRATSHPTTAHGGRPSGGSPQDLVRPGESIQTDLTTAWGDTRGVGGGGASVDEACS